MTLRQINEDGSQKNTILLEPLRPSTVQLAQTRVYLYLEQHWDSVNQERPWFLPLTKNTLDPGNNGNFFLINQDGVSLMARNWWFKTHCTSVPVSVCEGGIKLGKKQKMETSDQDREYREKNNILERTITEGGRSWSDGYTKAVFVFLNVWWKKKEGMKVSSWETLDCSRLENFVGPIEFFLGIEYTTMWAKD